MKLTAKQREMLTRVGDETVYKDSQRFYFMPRYSWSSERLDKTVFLALVTKGLYRLSSNITGSVNRYYLTDAGKAEIERLANETPDAAPEPPANTPQVATCAAPAPAREVRVQLEPVAAPAAVTPASGGMQPSRYQTAILDWVEHGEGSALVAAVAGSGKSSTLEMAARRITGNGIFIAFNVHIAEALQKRLAGTTMSARTIHSVGNGALFRAIGKSRVDSGKYRQLCRAYIETHVRDSKLHRDAAVALHDLSNFARVTLTDIRNGNALADMIDRYSIEIDDAWAEVVADGLPVVLEEGQRLARDEKVIDFTDMLWLPLEWNLPLPAFDVVAVDEAQDLSAAQRGIALRLMGASGRMIAVGDERQAIMQFAGADAESFWAIRDATNARELPLSICYRCPTSHLALAREIVPQIEARPNAPEGVIENVTPDKLAESVQSGDMIICRLTAPLIADCIELIKRRIPARVRGRDIGKQLTRLVYDVAGAQGFTWAHFDYFLGQYRDRQLQKLAQRQNAENQIEALQDRVNAIQACSESFNATSADDLARQIEAMFDDGKPLVTLSTIHRAKGLEARRVFIERPDKLPLIWPKQTPAQFTQELNCQYVAYTRATDYLAFVQ